MRYAHAEALAFIAACVIAGAIAGALVALIRG